MLLDELLSCKEQFGYTNQTISEKSGVPVSTVQKVFGGVSKPRQSTIEKLSLAFRAEKERSHNLLRETTGYTIGTSAQRISGEHNVDDYYALPAERRAELIDGRFYDMASPSPLHQLILSELSYQFQSAIKKKKGPCHVLMAPFDVQLDRDDKTMVQPDLFILCDKERLRDGRSLSGPPDLVCEILSPASRRHDMVRKFRKYKAAGVREYWIVDPEDRNIHTYDFAGGDSDIYTFEDTIPVKLYEGKIQIDFSQIFAELIGFFDEL